MPHDKFAVAAAADRMAFLDHAGCLAKRAMQGQPDRRDQWDPRVETLAHRAPWVSLDQLAQPVSMESRARMGQLVHRDRLAPLVPPEPPVPQASRDRRVPPARKDSKACRAVPVHLGPLEALVQWATPVRKDQLEQPDLLVPQASKAYRVPPARKDWLVHPEVLVHPDPMESPLVQ